MNFSPTYITSIVIVIVSILSLFKIKVSTEELLPIATALVTGIGGLIVLWRRYSQGDLSPLGVRKKPQEDLDS